MYVNDRGILNAAHILSLIGGLFVLAGGITVLLFSGFIMLFSIIFGGFGFLMGFIGILWGVLIIIIAVEIKNNPGNHVIYGILLIILSVLSFFGAMAGFFIGFLLTLIGGILAMIS
ncbi:MAG: DUF6114 domain-containing protein [Thermoplasmata archaeon]